MARSRGSLRGRGSPRRRSDWNPGVGGTGVDAVTGSGSIFLGSLVQAVLPGVTAARIRGSFQAFLITAATIGDGYQGAFGIGRTTTSAVLAGIASVPTPITDADWDGWMYHKFFSVHAQGVALGDFDAASSVNIDVDVKAMRKLDDDEAALFAVLEVTEIGAASMNVFFDSRILVLLP